MPSNIKWRLSFARAIPVRASALLENITVRASALFKILPSERPLFSKYCRPSVRSFQNITVRASALFKILSQLWVTARLQAPSSPILTWLMTMERRRRRTPTLSEADEVVIIALNPGELSTVHIIKYLISPQGVGNTLVKINISWLRKCRAHWRGSPLLHLLHQKVKLGLQVLQPYEDLSVGWPGACGMDCDITITMDRSTGHILLRSWIHPFYQVWVSLHPSHIWTVLSEF